MGDFRPTWSNHEKMSGATKIETGSEWVVIIVEFVVVD